LGVHTDASARFERGADPELSIVGAGRVVGLLEDAGWELVGESTQVGAWNNAPRYIDLDVIELNRFLGTELEPSQVSERLQRYGFELETAGTSGFTVLVPTHRIWDVHTVFDLYEEVAKSIGYNAIPTTLPKIDKGALPSRLEQNRDLVEQVLMGAGFIEVITDGFYGRTDFDKLGLPEDHVLASHVETQNSLDKGYSLLKNNCLLQAVDCVRKNMHRNFHNIKVYEWTRTFHLNPTAENGVCDEHRKLWAVVSGAERSPTWQGKAPTASPLYLKGLIAEIAGQLGLALEIKVERETHALAPLLHPHRQASIWLGAECVGILGEIHPRICGDFKIKRARPCYIELSQDILNKEPRGISYVLPAVHQPLVRTVAFALPGQVQAAAVKNTLASVGASVSIVDLFAFEDEAGPQRAITFEMTFANPDGSLTAEVCNQRLQQAMDAVLSAFGDQGVTHR
jgi:phenylalanyl-tRNA synthetase beta chain